MVNYDSTSGSTFRDRVQPRDVKSALTLLSYLYLELEHVVNSSLTDPLMIMIKESSGGMEIHFNSIGKVNVMFAWFVIDFLSMSILFDSFLDHRSLQAPKPFRKSSLSDEHKRMLVHNKEILIKFCKDHGGSIADKYFADKSKVTICEVKKIWATSTKFITQFRAGIVSSFASYNQTNTGDKTTKQKLWIHHYLILHLFHPFFRLYPGEVFDGKFCDDNYRHFLHKIRNKDLPTYKELYNDEEGPNYYWQWKGNGGKYMI